MEGGVRLAIVVVHWVLTMAGPVAGVAVMPQVTPAKTWPHPAKTADHRTRLHRRITRSYEDWSPSEHFGRCQRQQSGTYPVNVGLSVQIGNLS